MYLKFQISNFKSKKSNLLEKVRMYSSNGCTDEGVLKEQSFEGRSSTTSTINSIVGTTYNVVLQIDDLR